MPYYRCPECGLTTHSVARDATVGMCASCAAPLPFEAPLYPAARVGGRLNTAQNGAFALEEDVAQ